MFSFNGNIVYMNISVIIPVLNEEGYIGKTISSLNIGSDEEIIVVDGGSSDHTVSVASRYTDMVFVTRRGRGHQMHYGAERAGGRVLLFLHSDCILPENAFGKIREIMCDDNISAGAFDLRIDHPSFCFRVIEAGANIRSRITSVPYGDQGMFMRKEVYQEIGGFSDIPIMEDIDIAGRLKKAGSIVFVRPEICTSPRRWLKEGMLYTTLRDWRLALSYSLFNVSPEKLINNYKDVRK
ncbi:poly-beta-1,6-N-acetyl-D-glucosamine synthase [bacterium BMS3Abin07]|nr:poly-beta-1,6-N-acetyl-D-glucosamine synthase [bacterium BMS3Abin07]GBE32287.1 poly-beta-1,6-N-acetyl-D-glucosamine synthase [bacterium BMS3Bbin05]HDO21811.1 glycosyltransferase [Nitrospirota bacterium]